MTAQPLSGVRIIDLSGLAGAYGTRMLAALGAEVIKIEPPGGSALRQLGPFAEGAPPGEGSLWWAFLAMGTRSVVVDTTTSDGREKLAALIAEADVVVEDQAPDTLEGLGLGWPEMSATNPRLVWVSITPFGPEGPKRAWSSSNLIAWAASGVLYTVGFEDQPPVVPGGPAQMAMHAAALNAAAGAQLALRVRHMTGQGQRVDVALNEAALAIAPETGVPVFLDDRVHRVRSGNRRNLSRPFGLYPSLDGHVSLLILMPRHWEAIAEWIHEETGNESVTDPVFVDTAVRGEIMELIDEWTEALTTQHTSLELFTEGQRRGIPITPVSTIEGLRADPHLEATGFWTDVALPAGDEDNTVAIPGAPFRTNKKWWSLGRAPRLGEHDGE